MINETPEGTRYRIGINYWFPKDDRTLWRIVFCLPLFIWYQRNYYDPCFDMTVSSWRILKFSFRIRKRNHSKFPEGYGPMLFTGHSLYSAQLFS